MNVFYYVQLETVRLFVGGGLEDGIGQKVL